MVVRAVCQTVMTNAHHGAGSSKCNNKQIFIYNNVLTLSSSARSAARGAGGALLDRRWSVAPLRFLRAAKCAAFASCSCFLRGALHLSSAASTVALGRTCSFWT
jgi:hypothetical protein